MFAPLADAAAITEMGEVVGNIVFRLSKVSDKVLKPKSGLSTSSQLLDDAAKYNCTTNSTASTICKTEIACFVAGTNVLVATPEATASTLPTSANTTSKAIEKVKIGDLVVSKDQYNSQAPLQFKPVTKLYKKIKTTLVDIILDKGKITTTEEHPFYVKESVNPWILPNYAYTKIS